MAGRTITITCEDDGSYTVEVREDAQRQQAEQAAGMTQDDDGPTTVQSVDEVLAMVRQELSEDYDADDQGGQKAAWDQEAAGRDQQGYRQAGPAMSM